VYVPSSLGVHVAVPIAHALTAPESVRHAQKEQLLGNALHVAVDEPLFVTTSQNSVSVWQVAPASPHANETGFDVVPQPMRSNEKDKRSIIGPEDTRSSRERGTR